MKQETIDLYTPDQQVESINGVNAMATRFNTRNSDVIHALWLCAKDVMWAKLEQDVNERGKRIMQRKNMYILSGYLGDVVTIEINPEEEGIDMIKEATLLHQILVDSLPPETYDELVKLMGAANE